MRILVYRLAVCALAVCSGSVSAQSMGNPGLVEAGKVILGKLKPLSPGRTRAYYFEILRGPTETVGYATSMLTAVGPPGKLTYRYSNEGVIGFPTGDKLVAQITARLRHDFEPIEVQVWRARVMPDGTQHGSDTQAKIGDKTITLTSGEGDERKTKDVPRPAPPFIYAIECLVGQMELIQGARFLIREFDAASGGARDLEIEVLSWEDGSLALLTTTRDGLASYQFWFTQAGELLRWAEGSMPLMFVRVSKSQYDGVIEKIGKVERDRPVEKKDASSAVEKAQP